MALLRGRVRTQPGSRARGLSAVRRGLDQGRRPREREPHARRRGLSVARVLRPVRRDGIGRIRQPIQRAPQSHARILRSRARPGAPARRHDRGHVHDRPVGDAWCRDEGAPNSPPGRAERPRESLGGVPAARRIRRDARCYEARWRVHPHRQHDPDALGRHADRRSDTDGQRRHRHRRRVATEPNVLRHHRRIFDHARRPHRDDRDRAHRPTALVRADVASAADPERDREGSRWRAAL